MIDTHVHVATDDVTRYPYADASAFSTQRYVFPAERLSAEMTGAGVAAAVLVQPFGVYGVDNSYALDSAAAHPDRFAAVCGTDPGAGSAQAGERAAGLRMTTLGTGVRLDAPDVVATCRAAAASALPVCLLTSRRHVPDALRLAELAPDTALVLDHLGLTRPVDDLGEVVTALSPLAEHTNVHLKLSTPVLLSGGDRDRALVRLLDTFGADRLLWGSNYPMSDLGGYAATVAAAREALAFLPAEVVVTITVRTARRLWPLRGQ